jgi:hypothetical protein
MINIILNALLKDIISIVVILILIIPGIYYIIKSKKQGKKCIGCPYANSCKKDKKDCK